MSDRVAIVTYNTNLCQCFYNKTSRTIVQNPNPGFVMRALYNDEKVGLVFIRRTGTDPVELRRGECLVELDGGGHVTFMLCLLEKHAERFFLHNYVALRDVLFDQAEKAWRDSDPTYDEILDTIARWNIETGFRSPDWDGVD